MLCSQPALITAARRAQHPCEHRKATVGCIENTLAQLQEEHARTGRTARAWIVATPGQNPEEAAGAGARARGLEFEVGGRAALHELARRIESAIYVASGNHAARYQARVWQTLARFRQALCRDVPLWALVLIDSPRWFNEQTMSRQNERAVQDADRMFASLQAEVVDGMRDRCAHIQGGMPDCSECGSAKTTQFRECQERSMDEGAAFYYKCRDCGHTWSRGG